jgi:hypothetical protein
MEKQDYIQKMKELVEEIWNTGGVVTFREDHSESQMLKAWPKGQPPHDVEQNQIIKWQEGSYTAVAIPQELEFGTDDEEEVYIENLLDQLGVEFTEMTLADLYSDFPCKEKTETEIKEYEQVEEFKSTPRYVVVPSKDRDYAAIFINNGACPLRKDWEPGKLTICTLGPDSDWPERNNEISAIYGQDEIPGGFASFVGVFTTPWAYDREMSKRRLAVTRENRNLITKLVNELRKAGAGIRQLTFKRGKPHWIEYAAFDPLWQPKIFDFDSYEEALEYLQFRLEMWEAEQAITQEKINQMPYCLTCHRRLDITFSHGLPDIDPDEDKKYRISCYCGELAVWDENGKREQ